MPQPKYCIISLREKDVAIQPTAKIGSNKSAREFQVNFDQQIFCISWISIKLIALDWLSETQNIHTHNLYKNEKLTLGFSLFTHMNKIYISFRSINSNCPVVRWILLLLSLHLIEVFAFDEFSIIVTSFFPWGHCHNVGK